MIGLNRHKEHTVFESISDLTVMSESVRTVTHFVGMTPDSRMRDIKGNSDSDYKELTSILNLKDFILNTCSEQ